MNTETPRRPGTAVANRPLHFFWICDCSGSMAGAKIQSLNNAIREAIPAMRDVADDNPTAQVLVRALAFSDGAQWHIGTPTQINEFTWTDLDAGGLTDMGKALKLLADELRKMPDRGLPPVLVLITDGVPTDDFKSGLNALMAEPWGKKAVRIAIAIGTEAEEDVLKKFIGNPEIPPLRAQNSEQLVRFIKWASTATVQSASSPSSQTTGADGTPSKTSLVMPSDRVAVPTAIPTGTPSADVDIF